MILLGLGHLGMAMSFQLIMIMGALALLVYLTNNNAGKWVQLAGKLVVVGLACVFLCTVVMGLLHCCKSHCDADGGCDKYEQCESNCNDSCDEGSCKPDGTCCAESGEACQGGAASCHGDKPGCGGDKPACHGNKPGSCSGGGASACPYGQDGDDESEETELQDDDVEEQPVE